MTIKGKGEIKRGRFRRGRGEREGRGGGKNLGNNKKGE